MGFAQKFGVRDPLPPAAAVPFCKGDNKRILPLEKGENASRQAVAYAVFLCKAPRQWLLSMTNSTVLKPLAGIVTNCEVGLKTSVGVTVIS
jgi:hypothetical protein